MQPAVIVSDPHLVDLRLAKLGLTQAILQNAVAKGEAARNTTTENDPAMLAGVLQWGRTVRGLRDELVPLGWSKRCDGNFELSVSPGGDIAVFGSCGDAATGLIDGRPRTKNPKGAMSGKVVRGNVQLLLPLRELMSRRLRKAECPMTCWCLLFYSDEERGETRFELSLPVKIEASGRISHWQERIILAPLDHGPRGVLHMPEDEPDLDVPVSWRSS